MSNGDIVMVRTFLNQPIKRRVLAVENSTIIIGTEEAWQRHGRGTKVPREQVFKWDEALFKEMQKFDEQLDSEPPQLEELWRKAIPY
ncbi:hypothetical protein M1N05_02670 [Dehalococcoidales bacterium]|nr:hypothetical protein [Dehalococcoidales bacterium]